MKRIIFVLLYALLAVAGSAQTVYVRTQDKDGNVSPSEALSGPVGTYRFTIYPTDSGAPIDLSSLPIRFIVTDLADDKVVVSNAPSLVGTNYGFRGEGSLTRATSTNSVRIMAYPDGSDPYALYWALLTITSAPSAGASVTIGASTTVVNVAVSGTNLIQASIDSNAFAGASFTIQQTTIYSNQVQQIFTNQWLPQTTNGGVIYQYVNTNATGGGSAPINGERPTNLTFNASYPFTVSSVTNEQGMTITYGLSGNAGTVIVPAGNTSTSFLYYVNTNAQFYTASPIATQLLFFAIGSAAGYSAGGLAMRYVACTGSQVFACYIPQGGLSVSNATAQGGWGYVKGGSATSTNGNYATSGGGSLAVLTDTNVVIHLGGAGGTASSAARVNGGGVNGYSYGTTASGGGATATNHGAAATAAAGATAGSSTGGGNGTAAGGTFPGGGGGGGPFAGGGGCGAASSQNNAGGAGSTDVWDGYTARSAPDSASPPSTDHVLYKTPYGVGLTTITNNARANSGFLAIVSYPSP